MNKDMPELELGDDVVVDTSVAGAYVTTGGIVSVISHSVLHNEMFVQAVCDKRALAVSSPAGLLYLVARKDFEPLIRSIHRRGKQIYPKLEQAIEEELRESICETIQAHTQKPDPLGYVDIVVEGLTDRFTIKRKEAHDDEEE